MAVDKRTLLREALKQVQAGKIDKAVETYRAILKIDPRDASVHNTLGDLFIKQGKKKDAIAEYLEAANLHEKDGFALRAVAMCTEGRSISTPSLIAVHIKLGDLYASQKLPAEGRAQYMKAANYYDKKGDVANALDDLPQDRQPRTRQPAGARQARGHVREAEISREGGRGIRPRRPGLRRQERDEHRRAALRPRLQALPGATPRRGGGWPISTPSGRTGRSWSAFWRRRSPRARATVDLLVLYAEALTRVNHPQDAVKVLERRPGARAELGAGEPRARPGLPQGRRRREGDRGAQPLRQRPSGREPARAGRGAAARDGGGRPRRRQDLRSASLEVAQKRGDKGCDRQAYLKLAAVYEKRSSCATPRGRSRNISSSTRGTRRRPGAWSTCRP